jgi:hypothetical protein
MDVTQIFALVVGIGLGVLSIVLARRVRGENWLYAAAVIVLPLIYVAFAVASGDSSVVLLELALGLPFILGGVLCLVFRLPLSAVVLGTLWILHAAFDIFHNVLFINDGVPGWYPIFCAAVDFVVGGYLIWRALKDGVRLREAPHPSFE